MGLIYTKITLVNSFDDTAFKKGMIKEEDIRQMPVTALVDTGAYMLTIPESIKIQLDLEIQNMADVELADGTQSKCEVVGPIDVRFKNRRTTCSAIVLPGATDVLLGAIPLEGMDVIIDPQKQELALPPDRPYVARTIVK